MWIRIVVTIVRVKEYTVRGRVMTGKDTTNFLWNIINLIALFCDDKLTMPSLQL